ncbi:protein spire homolog 2 isoform X2 [Lagenorhynchus albirostris]|uniref:protein spire homolog 2 isoform X2 n=1 Tax=Lagenorhynchus albirostris TaxID=27610 RepID=UPI0028E98819|nr:protein spire homolog 2 isoform X2 [Lagenorhynchus albirostris]
MARAGSSSGNAAAGERAGGAGRPEPWELSLEEVLKAYEQPINEEQAWAVCFQCCRGLRGAPGGRRRIRDTADILLRRDGSVSAQREPGAAESTAMVSPASSEAQVVQSLGFAIYRALDWGLAEHVERELSPQLERLIDLMANSDCDDDGGGGAADEGYGAPEEEEEAEGGPRAVRTFTQAMRLCAARLTEPRGAQTHYQAVCRALFVETLELRAFLARVREAKEMLQKLREDEPQSEKPLMELDSLGRTDWARLWVQLMRELRHGVKLKKVQEQEFNSLPTEFQLTPFEMLMQDIRARNYKLRKVMGEEGCPRTYPGLHPLPASAEAAWESAPTWRCHTPCRSQREGFAPYPRNRERCMRRSWTRSSRNAGCAPWRTGTGMGGVSGVSTGHPLLCPLPPLHPPNPSCPVLPYLLPAPGFGSLPCILNACSGDVKSTSCINLSITDAGSSAQRQRPRVLLKAPTLAEMEEMNISEEEESPCGEVTLRRDRSFSEHDLAQLRSEVTSGLQPPGGLERARPRADSVQSWTPSAQEPGSVSVQSRHGPSSPPRSDLGSVEDGPGASEWLEFSHPVESLALTVEEVMDVRRVLVKAEMEKFLQNKELFSSLKKGKICCCCRTKFPLFSWPSTCLFCKRAVCSSCSIKMKMPSKKFAHIPVYALGFESPQRVSTATVTLAQRRDAFQPLQGPHWRSVEEEFPHIYTHGCVLKDVCSDCTGFVADVVRSSRRSVDALNTTPRRARQTQSLYVPNTWTLDLK